MAKEICISTTPHETRLAILEDDQLAEIYYERENEYTLAGSIYKGRVTRVLPGMQSSFVDVGLERDAFLYVTDFLEEQEDSEEYETAGDTRRRGGEEAASSEERSAPRRENREPRGSEERRPATQRTQQAPNRNDEATKEEPGEAGIEGAAEVAPQGTRRWRGRRGRRRGGMRSGALAAVSGGREATAEVDLPETAAAPFALPEHGAPGGLAAPRATEAEPATEDGSTNGSIELRAASEQETNQRSSQGAAAHMLLPGESLSKYGSAAPKSTAAPAVVQTGSKRAVNYVAPRPATQVEVGEGWDGGFVMPGERISRYSAEPVAAVQKQSAVAPEPPNGEAKDDAASHAEEGAEEGAPDGAGQIDLAAAASGESVQPMEWTTSPSDEQTDAARSEPEQPQAPPEVLEEPQRQGHEGHVAQGDSGDSALEASPSQPATASGNPRDNEQEPEYEPKEGEAAAQTVPPGRSDLRFSQLFGGGSSTQMSRETEPPAQEEEARSTVEAGLEPQSELSEATSQPGFVLETVHAEIDPELAADFGEQYEEEPLAAFDDDAGMPDELALPSSPQVAAAESGSLGALIEQLQSFAPGHGLLEEEVIDEEEYDFDPLHAHADEHDLEDLEEETLHGDPDVAEPEPDSFALRVEEAAEERVDLADGAEAEAELAFDAVEDEEEEAVSGESTGNERPAGSAAERERRGGRNGRRRGTGGGRRSAQTQDLPVISDLLKPGQEILVQIAKEPMAKKGARITSHIALPGRFLVFMPTVNHVGVSRKIASDEERQRLKRILVSEKSDSSGGFIVRTAAEGASEEELRADLRFLINLWAEIKQRADSAKAPALIYHDLNLVERILRDQVSSNFSTIWVDTEQEYERIVRFLNRFQPSLVRRVKLYTKETPLFEQFGIQEEISKALKSKVWLKSGGSIVINQTEALVAIDINTGKYVGKTARLEDTIVKTNLDAIPEIVRQIRLRDLGGIIVIDFIDMDERKNRQKVLTALEEALKVDRAPSKVLQFNDFGLVAITRKRVKQSLERTLSVQCTICAGTGMVKSPVTVCNEIYIELRKMQRHLEGRDVMLRVNPEVVKQLKSNNSRWINEYEEMIGKTVIIKSDPSLHPEQFDIH